MSVSIVIHSPEVIQTKASSVVVMVATRKPIIGPTINSLTINLDLVFLSIQLVVNPRTKIA